MLKVHTAQALITALDGQLQHLANSCSTTSRSKQLTAINKHFANIEALRKHLTAVANSADDMYKVAGSALANSKLPGSLAQLIAYFDTTTDKHKGTNGAVADNVKAMKALLAAIIFRVQAWVKTQRYDMTRTALAPMVTDANDRGILQVLQSMVSRSCAGSSGKGTDEAMWPFLSYLELLHKCMVLANEHTIPTEWPPVLKALQDAAAVEHACRILLQRPWKHEPDAVNDLTTSTIRIVMVLALISQRHQKHPSSSVSVPFLQQVLNNSHVQQLLRATLISILRSSNSRTGSRQPDQSNSSSKANPSASSSSAKPPNRRDTGDKKAACNTKQRPTSTTSASKSNPSESRVHDIAQLLDFSILQKGEESDGQQVLPMLMSIMLFVGSCLIGSVSMISLQTALVSVGANHILDFWPAWTAVLRLQLRLLSAVQGKSMVDILRTEARTGTLVTDPLMQFAQSVLTTVCEFSHDWRSCPDTFEQCLQMRQMQGLIAIWPKPGQMVGWIQALPADYQAAACDTTIRSLMRDLAEIPEVVRQLQSGTLGATADPASSTTQQMQSASSDATTSAVSSSTQRFVRTLNARQQITAAAKWGSSAAGSANIEDGTEAATCNRQPLSIANQRAARYYLVASIADSSVAHSPNHQCTHAWLNMAAGFATQIGAGQLHIVLGIMQHEVLGDVVKQHHMAELLRILEQLFRHVPLDPLLHPAANGVVAAMVGLSCGMGEDDHNSGRSSQEKQRHSTNIAPSAACPSHANTGSTDCQSNRAPAGPAPLQGKLATDITDNQLTDEAVASIIVTIRKLIIHWCKKSEAVSAQLRHYTVTGLSNTMSEWNEIHKTLNKMSQMGMTRRTYGPLSRTAINSLAAAVRALDALSDIPDDQSVSVAALIAQAVGTAMPSYQSDTSHRKATAAQQSDGKPSDQSAMTHDQSANVIDQAVHATTITTQTISTATSALGDLNLTNSNWLGCWNPGCSNLSGSSEAELKLQSCSGCKAARYCCRDCQTAHWKAHKVECKPRRAS